MPADAPSYVERQADRDLQAALRAREYCYVLDSRQVGKSSLLIRAMAALRAEGIRVGSCDLQRLGSGLTAEQFYQGLLVQIGRGIGLEREMLRAWQARKAEPPFVRFRAVLREVALEQSEQPLVVLVDEIELLRRQAFDTDEFLVGIRSFFTDRAEDPAFRRLTFCLAGSTTPDALIQNVAVTPFNIGKRIVPTDFTLAEAQPLGDAFAGTGRDGNALLKRVLYWTSGHPYLTQRVCKAVSENSAAVSLAAVDAAVSRLYFGRDPEDGQHLSFINRRVEEDPGFLKDPAGLLAVYETIHRRFGKSPIVHDDPKTHWHALLKLCGLAIARTGMLEVRNGVYHSVFGKEWVNRHMPDAELRRQTVERRKGFVQAALIFGAISMVIAILGWNAYSSGRISRLALLESNKQRDRAEYLSYVANMNQIQADYEGNNLGRVRELLDETGQQQYVAYRGFEWGYWNRLIHQDVFTLKGHSDKVQAVAYSFDGKRILTASWDKTAKVWDAVTGREIVTLKGHDGVYSAAFSPDGKRVVTGASDFTAIRGEVDVRDAKTGRRLIAVKLPHDWVASVAFSPGGQQIVASMGYLDHNQDMGEAKVWDSLTGHELLRVNGHRDGLTSAMYSPDGRYIATANNMYSSKVWDVSSGRVVLTLKGDTVAFSPDGSRIVTSTLDNDAKVWDSHTGRVLVTLKGHSNRVNSAVFSPDGRVVITSSDDNTAKLWDVANGRELKTLRGHREAVNSAVFCPDGRHVLTASGDGTAKVWDGGISHETQILHGAHEPVFSATFSPDARRVLTIRNDATAVHGEATVYDGNTGRDLLTLTKPRSAVTCASYFPDGRRIVTGFVMLVHGQAEGGAITWNVDTGKEMSAFDGRSGFVTRLAISADGTRILTSSVNFGGSRGTAKQWDVDSGREVLTLKSPINWFTSVAYSPDGRQIVTSSPDGPAIIWDASSGRRVMTLGAQRGGSTSVAFSSDGQYIVAGNMDRTAKVWAATTGREIRIFKGHAGPVYAAAFSPDCTRVVTGSQDMTAKVWDAQTGREILTLKGHAGIINSVAFSPDGRRILTGSDDQTARIWYSDTRDEPDWVAVARNEGKRAASPAKQ